MTTDTVSIAEAARRLDTTPGIMRRRVLRGDVHSEQPVGSATVRIPVSVLEPPGEEI